jgi:hypothetical protein
MTDMQSRKQTEISMIVLHNLNSTVLQRFVSFIDVSSKDKPHENNETEPNIFVHNHSVLLRQN